MYVAYVASVIQISKSVLDPAEKYEADLELITLAAHIFVTSPLTLSDRSPQPT